MSGSPPLDRRNEPLDTLVRQTGRHLAFYHVLRAATLGLDRGSAPAIYREIFNRADSHCPDHLVVSFEKGFFEGFDEASAVVRETFR